MPNESPQPDINPNMPSHGFARRMLWSIASQDAGADQDHPSVVLQLSSSDETRDIW